MATGPRSAPAAIDQAAADTGLFLGGGMMAQSFGPEAITMAISMAAMQRAPRVFYESDNLATLYHSAGVWKTIRDRFGDSLDHVLPDSIPDIIGTVLIPLNEILLAAMQKKGPPKPFEFEFKAISEERMLVGPTTIGGVRDQRYFWVTRIELGRLFQNEDMVRLGHSLQGNKLRIAKIDVLWSARVSGDVQFFECSVDNVKLVDIETTLTFIDSRRFGFECP